MNRKSLLIILSLIFLVWWGVFAYLRSTKASLTTSVVAPGSGDILQEEGSNLWTKNTLGYTNTRTAGTSTTKNKQETDMFVQWRNKKNNSDLLTTYLSGAKIQSKGEPKELCKNIWCGSIGPWKRCKWTAAELKKLKKWG